MKIAKKFVCMLLVACLVLGFMLTSGGAIRAYAENETAPELPIKFDFEQDEIDANPTGWTDHPDVVAEAPDTSPGAYIVDDGGNKVMKIHTNVMPHNLNFHTHYEFQPTDSALLRYRFKLVGRSNGSFLPMLLYTGMSAKSEFQCSPLSPFVVDNGQGYYNLYFGYSDTLNALIKEGLVSNQWYELVMLVDLKTDTRKMYLDGELLDLSNPKSVDRYTDKSEMSLNRISVGAYFTGHTTFLVDDIELLASAKATEVYFKETDYTIRVNSSIQPTPDFKPLGADPCELTFTSADPSIATVDENGVITGVKEGKTTISVKTETEGVAPATLNIKVEKEMTGKFENLPDTLDMPLRGHTVIEPQLMLDYEGDSTVEWFSSNPEVATIDEWGEVYALSEGQTTLTVRSKYYPTVKKEIPITVKQATVAQTIYVAPNGTGNGESESTPTSLDNALIILEGLDNANMTGNIEVVMADGYYYRTEALLLNEKHGGNNLYSVVFKAAEGAKPTIGGALHIAGSDFKESDIDGVYVVDVPEGTTARQLYVDNIRAIRAKQDGTLKKAEIYTNMFGQNLGLVCENTELLDVTNPEDLEIVWYNCWAHQRAGVSEIRQGEDGRVELIMDQPVWAWCFKEIPSTDFKINQVSQIENALLFLDEPGEWYLDQKAGKLYYMPREFEDISKVTVTVPAMDVWDQGTEEGAAPDVKNGLVNVFGSDLDHPVQNIHFEGITFADTTWTRPNDGYGHTVNEANYIRDGGGGMDDKVADAAVTVRRANGISFLGCTFTRIGSTGLRMTEGTKNSMIIGNHMVDIDGTAIQIGEPDYTKDVQNFNPTDVRRVIKNNDILNNLIHNIGVDYHSAAAISIGFAADMDVSYNDMYDLPYSGFHIGYGWNSGTEKIIRNTNISYNFIHEVMNEDISDGGAFYSNGNTTGNNKIFNNYFRNQGADVAAIYFDSGAGRWEVVNNVVDLSDRLKSPTNDWYIDWTYAAATSHHIFIHNNFFWDKDEELTYGFNGTNGAYENNTRVWGGDWPEEALKIMEEAGLQEAYQSLKNNQVERLFTNLTEGVVTMWNAFRKVKLDTDDAEKKSFQIEVSATDGKDQPINMEGMVSYYVEDETIATVSESGLVTALKAGQTTLRIYVLSDGVLQTIKTTVEVTGETVETLPTEVTEPTGTDAEQPAPQNPVIWIVIGIVAVAAVAVVVILLPKKKADK